DKTLEQKAAFALNTTSDKVKISDRQGSVDGTINFVATTGGKSYQCYITTVGGAISSQAICSGSNSVKQEFIQAAFNQVAKIVSEHGHPVLEACCPAEGTEDCLKHLSIVASEWSYDPSQIDAHIDTYIKANTEIRNYLGEYDD
ncbi:hypothetical protein GWI33_009932, partial [Rhynchophorus ferrugineus]